MPGDTMKLKNLIEEISGKVAGKDFGICYNPEFIALGSVIRDFLNPDFVLIGEYDKRSGDILEEMYKSVCLNNPPIMRMNIINAEIAKIALNSYITMKMTFANFLAELCERYEGADVDVITRAIGTDSRIGVKYFKGGPSYGGPCFPRDNRAVALVAERVKVNSTLPKLIDSLNKHHTERIAEIIRQNLKENSTVSILGLTYKPNTNVIEESVGINLSNILLKSGSYNLKLYDPLAKDSLKQVFDDKRVRICEDIHEAIKDTDAIVITVLHKEFKELPNIIKDDREILIIDCWRNFRNKFSNKVKYHALGIGKKKENS
jgi:UDPglucose 6-dehydrogenase